MRLLRKTPVLLLALALLPVACSTGPDQPETVAEAFAAALSSGDAVAAAALTDAPDPATATLTTLFENLGANDTVRVVGTDDNFFTLESTWKFGPEGRNEWTYTSTGSATDADGWKIDWDPRTVAPGLDLGPLSYSPVWPRPARVLDATGGELMTEQVVTLVRIAPDADLPAVAALLAPHGVTEAGLRSALDAAQGKSTTAAVLREADIAPVRDPLTGVFGVTLAPQTRLLTVDKALTGPALAGLAELWQEQADAAAGWAVRAQTAQGTQRIAGPDATTTSDITTTIDIDLQNAAEGALAPLTEPAAIVALRPSTGEVLAVAQNAPADAQGPIALTGLYPPGSTFKTVTASAALQADSDLTVDTVLPCPGKATIEGRTIPNDNGFDLGQVPLHTAFARSCNTTMAELGVRLPPDGLTAAAAQLGLGVDYVTPGLTTVTGKVPSAENPAQRVESSIGQGTVTASPFGMALVAASLAHGSTPAPAIVRGQPGTADRQPEPVPAEVTAQIAAMMAETVSVGTATALRDIPGLLGKTGTAEYLDDTRAHGWFVGIDGDLAFAVFVADAGSSGPAVEAAGRMLRVTR
ncbi:penicillin-binding protein [Nocardia mangyaensis]|uniref:Penicillin-binding protein n=1 Tax=Nocardia mangyaensis TaxID=2213200 RepID=A0A1J0VQ57_9NOCA|nr:penicillin-binding transpeptidase domain-containing protein [Nocardia mangyaensis]APE34150.1 penicillin-binding protein [Nocardia mangyaensis]